MRLILLAICLVGLAGSALSTTVVCDLSGRGDFSSLTDAITGSSPDDTIYVVPNGASYENITLTSPRTFIGSGFFGGTTGANQDAILGIVTFSTGAAGSRLISCE